MWVSQIFGEKTSSCSYLKETRSLSLNFIFLNKKFTVLNNRENVLFILVKVRLNYVLKFLQSA